MKRFFVLLYLLSSITFSQENSSAVNIDLFSPSNIKKFGDYLYCQQDYLRAIEEYRQYLTKEVNDTLEFKIALAYSKMENYKKAGEKFAVIKESSPYYLVSKLEEMKSLFQSEDFSALRDSFRSEWHEKNIGFDKAKSLYNFSFLFTKEILPNEQKFLDSFSNEFFAVIKKYYEWKKDPPEKDPLTAAILSAIIPGSGKFYTREYSDGIWAFLASVGFAYLSYDNFHAKHEFRGWLFGGLAAGFYAGNIYGAAASAQLYNAKIHFDFVNDLKEFLSSHNYFLSKFNFCK